MFVSCTSDTNWWSNMWEHNQKMEDSYIGDMSKCQFGQGLLSMSIMSFIISVSNSKEILKITNGMGGYKCI